MNLILGSCKHRSSAQGLLMVTVNIQVQCPVLWLQFELILEKLNGPSLSHYSLEGGD